jgi:GalNAc-alpha-(1->4)-GalNAc-alpha-(1->3)-diNAcBac-PP-undecaprenol alpha-1,4-N-acetyl-D-galactosaminyltransferase
MINHIAIVLADLQIGGAQRVATILANEWLKLGVRVTILTLDKDRAPAFPLEAGVTVTPLALSGKSPNKLHAALANFVRIKRIRHALLHAKPDVVIGFGEVESAYAYMAVGRDLPVICYFQTNPRHRTLNGIWRKISQAVMPKMAGVVVQTLRGQALLKAIMPNVAAHVIGNPVPTPHPLPKAANSHVRLMAAGRFDPAKGFDLLIAACGALPATLPDWQLTIWGDGVERPKLVDLIAKHKLIGKVHLPGFTNDMGQVFADNDVFVLSSRREGFPNVLVEAMAAGLAVLTTDCETGPSDILRNYETGLLVASEDVQALAIGLETMISDADIREKLAQAAPAAIRPYAPAQIASDWVVYLASLPARLRD